MNTAARTQRPTSAGSISIRQLSSAHELAGSTAALILANRAPPERCGMARNRETASSRAIQICTRKAISPTCGQHSAAWLSLRAIGNN